MLCVILTLKGIQITTIMIRNHNKKHIFFEKEENLIF